MNIVARRYCYKAVFPLSPRDFVCMTTWTYLAKEKAYLIATVSLPDDYYPVDHKKNGNYVRGRVFISCSLLKAICPNVTEVAMINHTYVAATVPSYLLNQASVTLPIQYVSRLKAIIADQAKLQGKKSLLSAKGLVDELKKQQPSGLQKQNFA
jgi:hypothetical protein